MTLKTQMFSYASVNILNAAVPFILLPILTAYLNPNDYGLLSLIQLLMVISLPIVLMNTHGLLIIEYSKLSKNKFQKLLSTIIWIPLIGFIFLEILFYIFETYLVVYFHIPIDYIYVIPIFILLQSIPTIVPIIFQARKEPLNFGKYKISMTILNVLFSLLLVVILNYGWEGRLFGMIGSFFIFTFIGLTILIRLNLLKFYFDIDFLREALNFGLPLIPHTISVSLLAMSDRIFLSSMTNLEIVGIYSVAFQVSSIVMITFTSINQAWAPNLYEKLNLNPTISEKNKIIKDSYKIMLFMIFFTFIFILFIPIIFIIFVDEKYIQAQSLVIIIAIAFLFKGFYFMVTNYIFYVKKTYILSTITVSSVLVVSLLNYILINQYGINGAAYAMLIANILFFIIVWYFANKLYPMPWFFIRVKR